MAILPEADSSVAFFLSKDLRDHTFSSFCFAYAFLSAHNYSTSYRLKSLYRGMVADLSTMRHIVVHVMVQKRYVLSIVCCDINQFAGCVFFLNMKDL